MSGSDASDSGPTDPADEIELQAAEYVLGALSPGQARALEMLAVNDPAVAESIALWEVRLAPLAELVPLATPPATLWRRLALATGIDSGAEGAAPVQVVPAPVVPAPFVPAPVVPAPVILVRQQGRRGAGIWRATALGSMAIAAGLAFLLYTRPARGPEPLMAALSPYGGPGATFLVRVDASGLATVVALGDTKVPPGRSLELWAVTAGAAAPVSMGLLPMTGRGQLTVPAQSGTQLLVSQEPAGGSPTRQPTGPVVYSGQLTGI